jgi:hypothetical protein
LSNVIRSMALSKCWSLVFSRREVMDRRTPRSSDADSINDNHYYSLYEKVTKNQYAIFLQSFSFDSADGSCI